MVWRRHPTLFVGIHGTIRLHPWVEDQLRTGHLEHDLYSLTNKRSVSYGWWSADPGSAKSGRWGHNDAGGDWRPGGHIREVGWFQVDISPGTPPHHIPVLPATRVLNESLAKIGTVGATGLHALVPMHLAQDSRFDLMDLRDWAQFVGPGSNRTVEVQLTSADPAVSANGAKLARYVSAMAGPELAQRVHPLDAGSVALGGNPAGCTWLGEDVTTSAYVGELAAWSMDHSVWLIDLFIESLRSLEVTAPVLISASLAGAAGGPARVSPMG